MNRSLRSPIKRKKFCAWYNKRIVTKSMTGFYLSVYAVDYLKETAGLRDPVGDVKGLLAQYPRGTERGEQLRESLALLKKLKQSRRRDKPKTWHVAGKEKVRYNRMTELPVEFKQAAKLVEDTKVQAKKGGGGTGGSGKVGGGGGGSYNSGTSQNNSSGVGIGNGYVIIDKL